MRKQHGAASHAFFIVDIVGQEWFIIVAGVLERVFDQVDMAHAAKTAGTADIAQATWAFPVVEVVGNVGILRSVIVGVETKGKVGPLERGARRQRHCGCGEGGEQRGHHRSQ